jgi:hypothetical protein
MREDIKSNFVRCCDQGPEVIDMYQYSIEDICERATSE